MTKQLVVSEDLKVFIENFMDDAGANAEWHPVDRAFIEEHWAEIFSIDPVVFVFANFETGSQLWANNFLLCVPDILVKLEVDDIEVMVENFTTVFAYFSLIEFSCKYLGIDILPMILNSKNIIKRGFKDELIDYLKRQWYVLLITESTKDALENDMKGVYLKYNPKQWEAIRQKFLQDDRVKEVKTNYPDFKKYLSELIGSPVIG